MLAYCSELFLTELKKTSETDARKCWIRLVSLLLSVHCTHARQMQDSHHPPGLGSPDFSLGCKIRAAHHGRDSSSTKQDKGAPPPCMTSLVCTTEKFMGAPSALF